MTSEKDPELLVEVLRALLGGQEVRPGCFGLRYKELREAVKDRFGSKETLQVYLDWLVQKKTVKREQESRKNVRYVVDAENGYIMSTLSGFPLRTHKNSIKQVGTSARATRINPKELVGELTSEVVNNFAVAIIESLDPDDDIAKNLGPSMVIKVLSEVNRLTFEESLMDVLNDKNSVEIAAQILKIARKWR